MAAGPRPPAIRKDFLFEPYQVAEARALNADCILVIMASLDDARPPRCWTKRRAGASDALIEVHDEAEMTRALALGGEAMIGVTTATSTLF